MKYLICLDLDGCVLDDEKNVGQELIDVIANCKKHGCVVTFNTTRNFNRVKRYLTDLNPDYVNCLSGCYVKKLSGDELFNYCIPEQNKQQVFKVTNKYKELNLVCSEWVNEEFVTSKDYALKHNKTCKSLHEIQKQESYKLIYFFDKDIPPNVQNELNECNVNATISTKHKYLRIMPKRDKWDGIKVILDDLKFKDIKIISFGNDLTDYITLQNSHVGVAMLNAEEDLKKDAKYITEFSNNENGIAQFLKKYFNKEGF